MPIATSRPSPRALRITRRGRTPAGAPPQSYVRERDLPRLLPLWPCEVADRSPEGHHRLLQRLRRALREERRRGLAGDWAYDLARHANLYRAYKAELARTPPPLTSWAAAPFRRQEPTRPPLDRRVASPARGDAFGQSRERA